MKTWQIGALVGGIAVAAGVTYYLKGDEWKCKHCSELAKEGRLSKIVRLYSEPCPVCMGEAWKNFERHFKHMNNAVLDETGYQGMSEQETRDEYTASIANMQIIRDRSRGGSADMLDDEYELYNQSGAQRTEPKGRLTWDPPPQTVIEAPKGVGSFGPYRMRA